MVLFCPKRTLSSPHSGGRPPDSTAIVAACTLCVVGCVLAVVQPVLPYSPKSDQSNASLSDRRAGAAGSRICGIAAYEMRYRTDACVRGLLVVELGFLPAQTHHALCKESEVSRKEFKSPQMNARTSAAIALETMRRVKVAPQLGSALARNGPTAAPKTNR